MEKHHLSDPEKIIIRKQGQQIFLLSRYSETQNVATRFIEGNENSYFLPTEAPLEDIYSGKIFAQCWDNLAPVFTEKHGIIGANHGSPFAFRVHLLRHWLFESDIGKVLTDDAGKKFVLVSIENLSDFTLHSDTPEPGGTFCRELTGNLHLDSKTIVPETVQKGMLSSAPGGQISPHHRYNSTKLLADGVREIADGETAMCKFAELHWDIDLILPETLLEFIKAHPGHYVSPIDLRLEGTVRSKVITTFRNSCTRTVDWEFIFLKDMPEPMHCGILQYYTEVPYSRHERLLPGVKPVTTDGLNINLADTYRFPEKFPVHFCYTKKNCIDPGKLPCRYIDFFGNNEKREVGVALGYSMTQGITARGREAERGDTMMHLYCTTKIYPYAFEKKQVRAGEKFRICSYQQFFQPDESGVSCYHHQEQDGYFLYADFPRAVSQFKVKLPVSLAGKKITVLEQAPGITVQQTLNTVPADGVVYLSATQKGGIVLKIGQ